MVCTVCGNRVTKNYASDETPICTNCIETIEGQEVVRGLATKALPSLESKPPSDESPKSFVPLNGTMRGIFIGVVIALITIGGGVYFKDAARISIVKDCLAYYDIPVEDVEILQYSTYPTNQSADLQNFIVQGSSKGYLFRAKIQYMKGRNPRQNGVEFQQGSMTKAMGSFYNF